MNPHQTYQNSALTDWTRIDMLVALYRETESAILAAIQARKSDQSGEFSVQLVRSLKLLLAILDGIDPTSDTTAANIQSLCVYMIDQVSKQTLDGLESAAQIIKTLREGFEEIHEEATLLEREGKIPSLSNDLDYNLTVG